MIYISFMHGCVMFYILNHATFIRRHQTPLPSKPFIMEITYNKRTDFSDAPEKSEKRTNWFKEFSLRQTKEKNEEAKSEVSVQDEIKPYKMRENVLISIT